MAQQEQKRRRRKLSHRRRPRALRSFFYLWMVLASNGIIEGVRRKMSDLNTAFFKNIILFSDLFQSPYYISTETFYHSK